MHHAVLETTRASAHATPATHPADAAATLQQRPSPRHVVSPDTGPGQFADPCLPCRPHDTALDGWGGLALSWRKLHGGEVLFNQGDACQYLYAVHSGTCKSTLTLADGRDQIASFTMAGEVIGLDGIASGRHASTTSALEDSLVCAIAYAPLVDLIARDAALQRRVSRLMSREIVRGHRRMMWLGLLNAQERLAVFLLDLSQRFDARGYSAQEFNLRMTRAEIGRFLGLSMETVSRTFAQLQREGTLDVHHRHVRIQDLAGFSRHYAPLLQMH